MRSREACNVFTRTRRAAQRPTWGELLGSLVVLVGLGLALGVVDARGSSAGRRPRAGPDTDTQELMPRGFVPYESRATGRCVCNYDIRYDDKYGHLARIDVAAEGAGYEPWVNQTLTSVMTPSSDLP